MLFIDVVDRELGVGTFGRVFRCKDQKYNDYVAVKVVRRVRRYTESAMIEADILEDVRRKLKHSSCNVCVKMYDHFKFEGIPILRSKDGCRAILRCCFVVQDITAS